MWSRGFSLIELLVVISIVALMLGMLAPNMSTWIANNKVQGTAESLASELRLAQLEALRRNRQVVFALTDEPPSLTAVPNDKGLNWFVRVLPLTDAANGVNEADGSDKRYSAAAMYVHGSNQAKLAAVTIDGPAMLCFNALGRPVSTASVAVGGLTKCKTPTDAVSPVAYTVKRIGADRSMQAQVTLGGQIRVCNPAKSQASGQAEGC